MSHDHNHGTGALRAGARHQKRLAWAFVRSDVLEAEAPAEEPCEPVFHCGADAPPLVTDDAAPPTRPDATAA